MVRGARRRASVSAAALLTLAASSAWGQVGRQPAASPPPLVIACDPSDPYHPLAQEIADSEAAPLAASVAEALELDPVFLVLVSSPAGLSDALMVQIGRALLDPEQSACVGIISGQSLQSAGSLWQRASEVRVSRVYAGSAANPSARIFEGRIIEVSAPSRPVLPLTTATLRSALAGADYLTFTGHGGPGYWRLDEDTTLRADSLPPLGPAVFAAASCQTFRPWTPDSIALAFVERGAAAYVGFAYGPNEGFLLGEFDGAPFRYTSPDFPVGCALRVLQSGTVQGFARFPYLHILGDPRIALADRAPYSVVADQGNGATRTLVLAGAPAGVIPVRIPGGAAFGFVRVAGASAASKADPFFNSRLQMVDIGEDTYLLVDQGGGEIEIRMRRAPPPLWVLADLVLDSFDNVLIFMQLNSGDLVVLGVAGVAWVIAGVRLARRRESRRGIRAAACIGLAAALVHALYLAVRAPEVTITTKPMAFSILPAVATLLLVSAGAVLYVGARARAGRILGVAVSVFGSAAPALFLIAFWALTNARLASTSLGVGLYNYRLGFLAWPAFACEVAVLAPLFALARRAMGLHGSIPGS